jgi:hypothetical protein
MPRSPAEALVTHCNYAKRYSIGLKQVVLCDARAWDWPEEKIFRTLSVPFKRPAPRGIVTINTSTFRFPAVDAVV